MKENFKVKVLCRYRRNERNNKYSIEFCEINNAEYAVYVIDRGITRCVAIDSDYSIVKSFFKKCILVNF